MVMDDFHLLILTIPFIDRSLQMDSYKVHNLSALHPDLGVQFSYVMEEKIWQSLNMDCMLMPQHDMILESAWLLKDTFAGLTRLFVL